jgi:hypothetical protein
MTIVLGLNRCFMGSSEPSRDTFPLIFKQVKSLNKLLVKLKSLLVKPQENYPPKFKI